MKDNIGYYQHDVNADQHGKFKMLRVKYGWSGEGKFWALNNRIGQADDCFLDLQKKYNKATIANDLDFTLKEFDEFLQYLIDDCNLIISKNGKITTDRIQETLERVMKERERNQINYKKRNPTNKHDMSTDIKQGDLKNQRVENIHSTSKVQVKYSTSKEKESKEYICSIEFLNSIIFWKADFKKPTEIQFIKNWVMPFKHLFDIDKRSYKRTLELIGFIKTDNFIPEDDKTWDGWRGKIMSAKKFRIQWDKVDISMKCKQEKIPKDTGSRILTPEEIKERQS